jgi:hypothetical protein
MRAAIRRPPGNHQLRRPAKMKTKIMKSLLNITPVVLFAAALILLYRANMELKYNYESLEWRVKNKAEQIDAVDAELWRRTMAHPGGSKVTAIRVQ